MASIRMPAGEYYIGDPCYVISEWDEFLEPMWDANGESAFLWKGRECVVFSTAYGDGCYEDRDGYSYPVDAGCIGAVPVELCNGDHPSTAGNVFMFREDWDAKTDGETLRFGTHVIPTGDEEDNSDDDYCPHCGR